ISSSDPGAISPVTSAVPRTWCARTSWLRTAAGRRPRTPSSCTRAAIPSSSWTHTPNASAAGSDSFGRGSTPRSSNTSSGAFLGTWRRIRSIMRSSSVTRRPCVDGRTPPVRNVRCNPCATSAADESDKVEARPREDPMVRAITFDAFGTLIDTGRDVLIRIARSVCEDQRPSLDAEALLATWDRHFFAAETAPFLTLAQITEDSLEKTFREYGIEATPAPYVDRLVALWRQAKAHAEVPRI